MYVVCYTYNKSSISRPRYIQIFPRSDKVNTCRTVNQTAEVRTTDPVADKNIVCVLGLSREQQPFPRIYLPTEKIQKYATQLPNKHRDIESIWNDCIPRFSGGALVCMYCWNKTRTSEFGSKQHCRPQMIRGKKNRPHVSAGKQASKPQQRGSLRDLTPPEQGDFPINTNIYHTYIHLRQHSPQPSPLARASARFLGAGTLSAGIYPWE